jgi:hypothetical protein
MKVSLKAPSLESQDRTELDGLTRFIHLGLTVFGLLALKKMGGFSEMCDKI